MVLHFKPKCKISASRKLSLKVNGNALFLIIFIPSFQSIILRKLLCLYRLFKILLLARATEELEAEKAAREEAKVHYLGEKLPPLEFSGLNVDDLQVGM